MRGFFQLFAASLTYFFLIRTSTADTHCKLTHVIQPINLGPSGLDLILTHTQAGLHAFWLLSHIEGNCPSLPSWPVLAEKPLSIHHSTSVI